MGTSPPCLGRCAMGNSTTTLAHPTETRLGLCWPPVGHKGIQGHKKPGVGAASWLVPLPRILGLASMGEPAHPCQNQAVHPASLPAPFPDSLAVSIETGWISKRNMVTEGVNSLQQGRLWAQIPLLCACLLSKKYTDFFPVLNVFSIKQ